MPAAIDILSPSYFWERGKDFEFVFQAEQDARFMAPIWSCCRRDEEAQVIDMRGWRAYRTTLASKELVFMHVAEVMHILRKLE